MPEPRQRQGATAADRALPWAVTEEIAGAELAWPGQPSVVGGPSTNHRRLPARPVGDRPIVVPKQFEDLGYTPQTFADQIELFRTNLELAQQAESTVK